MKIYWLNADPALDLQQANLATKRLRTRNPLTREQWVKSLKAEHSTLRFLSIVIHDEDCPYTVACQIVRHTKEHTQPEMSSARPDWTGAPRDYTKSRWLHIKFTPIGLVRMMEDRLCSRAEKETMDWATNLRDEMLRSDNWMIRELASFCAPTCVKHGFCKNGGCDD
jgi:hypothetical protein